MDIFLWDLLRVQGNKRDRVTHAFIKQNLFIYSIYYSLFKETKIIIIL